MFLINRTSDNYKFSFLFLFSLAKSILLNTYVKPCPETPSETNPMCIQCCTECFEDMVWNSELTELCGKISNFFLKLPYKLKKKKSGIQEETFSIHSQTFKEAYKIHTFCTSQQHTTSVSLLHLRQLCDQFGQKIPKENETRITKWTWAFLGHLVYLKSSCYCFAHIILKTY